MVRFKEINGRYHFWEIDNAVFRTSRYLNYGINDIKAYIEELKDILENDLYQQSDEALSSIASRFEGADFIMISFAVCKEPFLRMFEHYCVKFIEEGKIHSTTTTTKKVPIYQVFQLILGNDIENSGVTCWPINLVIKKLNCRKILFDIANRSFDYVWLSRIMATVSRNEDLFNISREITAQKTIEYLGHLDKNLLRGYLLKRAETFTLERRQINFNDLILSIVDVRISRALMYYDNTFTAMLREVMETQSKIHFDTFCRENNSQMHPNNDKWILYNTYGPSLRKTVLNFTCINCKSIALELKYFIKWKYGGRGRISRSYFSSCVIAVNALTAINSDIRYFSDITEADARALVLFLENNCIEKTGAPLSQYSIAKSVHCCKSVIDYLMGGMRDEEIKMPRPYHNPFDSYSARNLREYNNATQAIPEEVIEHLDKHIEELSPMNRLLYNIFSNTGLRLKEVFFLEYDCLEPSRYDNLYQLKFKPYKVLMARKRNNAEDYHRVLISKNLADEITVQIKASSDLRKTTESPFIFLTRKRNQSVVIMDSRLFICNVQAILDKYKICDDDGYIWHFTTRQFRKTIAVTLIENGATTEELAYWLGHMCSDTAAKYYAEVRKAKLAELNTRFFKEKFELLLSGEQLEEFSEEERRLLYTDFRLGQRRVELGYCLRKLADGSCGNRNSVYNCVNCKNLCTGKKYILYWKKLLTEQEQIVLELLRVYKVNGITEFQDFAEYCQESILLEGYKNVVNAIEEGERKI